MMERRAVAFGYHGGVSGAFDRIVLLRLLATNSVVTEPASVNRGLQCGLARLHIIEIFMSKHLKRIILSSKQVIFLFTDFCGAFMDFN